MCWINDNMHFICFLEDEYTWKGTKHHVPLTHCFLLYLPLQACCGCQIWGWNSPFNALMEKWLPDWEKEDLEERRAALWWCTWVQYLRVACIYVCVCVRTCIVIECDCTAYTVGWFARLVVCHSALEQPMFIYTKLSRGGSMCLSVCACVEAQTQQSLGFGG